jgi:hypothetical protein
LYQKKLQKGREKEGGEFATSTRKQKGGFPPTSPLSQNGAMQQEEKQVLFQKGKEHV